jgi:hypothetical protein
MGILPFCFTSDRGKHMNRESTLLRTMLVAALVTLSSCANINPKLATNADPGLRYYLTRPFVAVKQPYPVESSAYLVTGVVSADGKWVSLTAIPEALASRAPSALVSAGRLSASSILIAKSRSETDGFAHGADKTPEEPKPDETAKPETAEEPAEPPTKLMGTANITVTTDLTALARFELSKTISLVFLPDYDREFVIDTRHKLGTTRVTLNLGPGATLLGMSGEVDNSVVMMALLDSMKTLLTGGTDRLLGLVTGAATAPAEAEAEAHGAARAFKELAGQTVTLRAHLVKFAAIGVYPIVKPSEVASYRAANSNGRKFLLPVAGYQIPYDYYEVLFFEHVFGGVPAGFSVVSAPQDETPVDAPAESCVGKIGTDNVDDWWSKAVVGLPEGPDKERMKQLEVLPKPTAGTSGCFSAMTLGVSAKAGMPAATDTDVQNVISIFRAVFPQTTVAAKLGS